MFLQLLYKTLLQEHISSIINGLIHQQMDDIGKPLNDIQMNGSHLFFVDIYLSTQSGIIVKLLYHISSEVYECYLL
jgi:hypothetical protein